MLEAHANGNEFHPLVSALKARRHVIHNFLSIIVPLARQYCTIVFYSCLDFKLEGLSLPKPETRDLSIAWQAASKGTP